MTPDNSLSPASVTDRWPRLLFMVLGWLCVALGFIGAFLPVMPTTPFLLVALWCFSRSSRRFHDWLTGHKLLGPYVADWERARIIPKRAKIIAITSMTLSSIWVIGFTSAPWYAIVVMVLIMTYGAWFILRKPSKNEDA